MPADLVVGVGDGGAASLARCGVGRRAALIAGCGVDKSAGAAGPVSPEHGGLTDRVIRACLGLGFAAAGVTSARPADHPEWLTEWLERGEHGSMAYMRELVAERLDIRVMLPGAASVVMVADRYAGDEGDDRAGDGGGVGGAWRPRGRIARYARGLDYHRVMKRRLHRLCDRLRSEFGGQYRAFVDTGPVLEREQARRAGLGQIGKNTLLIHRAAGSYLLLGGFATTLTLRGRDEATGDVCGGCTRCLDACPTGAITPWRVDARRCISYLTIEHAGLIDPALQGAMGGELLGCDICQDVCPHNGGAAANVALTSMDGPGMVNPAYSPGRPGAAGGSLPLLEVLRWSEHDRSRILSGTSVKRATLAMLKRNALIALTNLAGDRPERREAAVRTLAEFASDQQEPDVVRDTARQCVARLSSPTG